MLPSAPTCALEGHIAMLVVRPIFVRQRTVMTYVMPCCEHLYDYFYTNCVCAVSDIKGYSLRDRQPSRVRQKTT